MRLRRWLLAASSLGVLGTATHAQAQTLPSDAPPAVRSTVDANGVDLVSGALTLSDTYVTIGGPQQGGMSWTYNAALTRDNFYGAINHSGSTYTVSLGGSSSSFSLSGTTFTSLQGDGSTLVQSGGVYTLTLRDGSVATFSNTTASMNFTQAADARVVSVVQPSGMTTNYIYQKYTINTNPTPDNPKGIVKAVRLKGVTNSLGYEIKYTYASNSGSFNDGIVAGVTGVNNAVEYCDPSADACTFANAWPSASVSGTSVTDALHQTTTYPTPAANATTTLSRPGGPNWTIAFDGSLRVASMNNGTGTWSYAYATSGATQTATVTDPLGHTRKVAVAVATGLVSSDTDGAGQTTSYLYDGFGRPTQVTRPEGGYTTYVYDGRGNVTQTTAYPKPSVGGTPITTSAGYDAACSNALTCNHPNWTRDGNGNQTDYTYNPSSGAIASITYPAPTAGAVRPQATFADAQHAARYYTAPGTLSTGAPVWQMTFTARCATAQTCIGTANSSESHIGYGPTSGPSNALAIQAYSGSGDGKLRPTSNFTYDAIGNLLTVADPLGNVTRYRYDADRRLTWTQTPDPDGSGPMRVRATRYTRDAAGRVTVTDQGSVPSQSDADLANFTNLAEFTATYDGLGRKVSLTSNGGVVGTATQWSYDAANRLVCTAQRMNAATFGSLPASACQLGAQGSYGPDRITYLGYDAADRPTAVTTGYGTPSARTESTTTYAADGLAQTQSDAKGNTTTYAYDGFDRLSQVSFPTASNGGVSNGADVIGYSYDANGALTQRRNRDGSTVTYAYDADGRLTSRSGTTLAASAFTYDTLGRLLTASGGGQTLSYGYDALGDLLSQSGPLGAIAMQYDLNRNLTRLQWPDGTYASYQYDAAGEVQIISDPYTCLSCIGYDDLGRRTSIGYATGNNQPWAATTFYSYGSDLRLSVITHTPTGGGGEVLGYAYNAAGQVRSSTSSNAAYDAASPSTASRAYATNGLNQYTTSGGAALGYDGLGNVTNDTRMTYSYDGLGKLVSLGNRAQLSYDAVDNLFQTTWSSTTRFLYLGSTIIGEYDASGAVLNRYVPGAGTDDYAAWYKAPGAGGYAGRRYMLSDRQGSVVAVVSDAGAVLGINTYDESGGPGASNLGRFQYDGAPWIPEAGLYHLRARDYSTTLGRFMQPDPTGYADGLNFYNYAHGDPVNGSDPSGLDYCYNNGFYTERPGYNYDDDLSGNTIIVAPKCGASFLNKGSGNGASGSASGGGAAGASPQSTQVAEVVVTARRKTIVLPDLQPYTLFAHYRYGTGDPVCLSSSQFRDLVAAGRPVGAPAPRAGGGYTQQTSYYGSQYANSFGTATLILDSGGNGVGFDDYYDFDFHARSTARAQFMTAVGATIGALVGGRDFSVDFNNGPC